jgi:hypothetical protein
MSNQIIYRLLKEKDISGPKVSGYKKRYPYTYSLPAISRITYKGVIRKVRYCPLEDSIFMDEQAPDAKSQKIRFENGMVVVDPVADPNKYEILENLNFNLSNKNRQKNREALYYRYDPNQKAEEALKKEEERASRLGVFWEMPLEKSRAMASALGIKTDGIEVGIWKLKLFEACRNNIDKFEEMYYSPDTELIQLINNARDLGFISSKDRDWYYGKVRILSVGIGRNMYIELSRHLNNNPNILESLTADVKGRAESFNKEEKIGTKYALLTEEDVFDMAKEIGILKYKRGYGYYFTDDEANLDQLLLSDRSKAFAQKVISENPEIKKRLFDKYIDWKEQNVEG